MKNYIMMSLCLLCAVLFTTSCKEEPYVENPSGEVFIYRLNVTNGGLTGAETYEGTVDEATKTVAFTIPAESDIEALKFSGKLSLGAKLDKESYDVSSGSAEVRVLNGENVGVYNVTVALNAPTQTPILQKLLVKNASGQVKEAFISELDKTVYLGCEESTSAEITEVFCLPKRTKVTFSEGSNNVISAENPGKVLMDFMGLTNEYRLSFEGEPVFGADFKLGQTYDFTKNPMGADCYPDFAAENTRSADFDGETMLIVSREGGTFPKVLKFADLKAGSPNEKVLNITGIAGGTYVISAGRLSHKHIYICNLTTGVNTGDAALKVYHWANEDAAPELVLEFTGEATNASVTGGRFGDNMSVNLDENGNGTMFFLTQDGTQMLRFDVQAFTTISNPTFITPGTSAPYYASVNQVVGSDNEYVLTSTQAPLMLIDRDGNELFKLDVDAIPKQGTDARIITYDAERYLIMTTGRNGSWSGDPVQVFYVYDLSAGANTVLALSNFAASERIPLFSFSLDGANCSAPAANTGWGIGDDGMLRLMTSAARSGFAVFEFPEKQ